MKHGPTLRQCVFRLCSLYFIDTCTTIGVHLVKFFPSVGSIENITMTSALMLGLASGKISTLGELFFFFFKRLMVANNQRLLSFSGQAKQT